MKRAGRRPLGKRVVTLRDVAREAGVSVASASRSLNGHANVTPATRDRVLDAARRLRFVPHTAARALSTRRTDTIGVMLPDLYGEFFSEIIRGADLAARAHGLHLLVATAHGDAAEAALAMRSMRGRVDGLLLMSPHVDGKPYASFNVDNHGGAMAVVRHLAAAGGKVAHIAGPANNLESQERLRGYRDAIGEAEGLVLQGDFTEESGYRAGLRLAEMRAPPRAVFAANDMMAIGCLLALEEKGVRVPDDMAVAGFDDIPIARLIRPSLTTARINIADLSGRALERLAEAIAGEEHTGDLLETVRPQLVVRQSSATQTTPAKCVVERYGEKRT